MCNRTRAGHTSNYSARNSFILQETAFHNRKVAHDKMNKHLSRTSNSPNYAADSNNFFLIKRKREVSLTTLERCQKQEPYI